ncbi:MAG: nitroreductase family protein [Acidimicrobiia bacterium]|nr:nitroreductase family protein [Acidimicrobiia bacterium]
MTDLFDVIHAQRAHRAFADRPVADADLARILDAAVYAPSAENKQPWEFVVVRDPAGRAAIGALIERAWNSAGKAFSHTRLSPALLTDVDAGATGGIAAAPVHIVVGADTERGLRQTVAESIFPAVQNLMLAAGAIGLGTALTTIAVGYADELRAIVGFPETVRPMAVIPVGYPARPLGPPAREPFAHHTHRDRYGDRWA